MRLPIPSGDDLLVRGTATFDLGLRTALGVAGVGPMLVRGDLDQVRAEVPCYRDLALRGDASASFPAPVPTPVSETVMARHPRYAPAGARVSTLSFDSPFRPIHPDVDARYLTHRANATVSAQRWQHGDRPRPTILVAHGFGASPYWFSSSFFPLHRLFEEGHDIVLYVLPFHGPRATHGALDGWGLFMYGLAHFNEAIGHAVEDLRILLDALEADGVDRVSATGFSLGGCVTALLASVDPRLAAVAPIAPVVDLVAMWRPLFPLNLLLQAASRTVGEDDLASALKYGSPLSYAPLVPRRRRLIVAGRGDRLTPPEHALALWRHWEEPDLEWFPGGHALHAGRGRYQRALVELFGSVAREDGEPATASAG